MEKPGDSPVTPQAARKKALEKKQKDAEKAKKKAETWEVDGLQHFICHGFLMCSLFSLVLN